MNEKQEIWERKNFWKWCFIITFIFLLASMLGYCQSFQHKFENNKIYEKIHKKDQGTGYYEEGKEPFDVVEGDGGKKLSNYTIKLPSYKYRVVTLVTPKQLASRWHCPINEFYANNPNLDPKNDTANNPTQPNKPIEDDSIVNVPSDNATNKPSNFEAQVIDLTNKARVNAGLKPLKFDDNNLMKSARSKSYDMMNNNYFDHYSKTYGSPFDMMKQYNISYVSAGENIAKDQQTPQEVVNAWLNSAGHRANIMNGSFTHIGVGFAEGKGAKLWTQQFIQK